ncbi:hypothetical protein A2U01_0085598, partial [Trifolium medium]|nr:hypothetical protein [Trifolium medium]
MVSSFHALPHFKIWDFLMLIGLDARVHAAPFL